MAGQTWAAGGKKWAFEVTGCIGGERGLMGGRFSGSGFVAKKGAFRRDLLI